MAERSFAELFIEQLEASGNHGFKLIKKFVTESRAEDVYLDFKEKENAGVASLSEGDMRHLAKAISGFAHSDGGVLVWGVQARRVGHDPESPDVARSLRPIKNLSAFHSNLNSAISQATRPPLPGVRNIKVPGPGKSSNGYVVTYVPVGPNPPYRASRCNNNFYKRAGSSFYPMEPFDLRDVILRGNYPKVTLDFGWLTKHISENGEQHTCELKLSISNSGPTSLGIWKLVIEYSRVISTWDIGQFSSTPKRAFSDFRGPNGEAWDRMILTNETFKRNLGSDLPILPEEVLPILGPTAPFHLFYQMNHQVFDEGGRTLCWRFYGANIPAQRGEIQVGPGSYCEF